MRAAVLTIPLVLTGCTDAQGSWVPEDYAPDDVRRVVFMGDSVTLGTLPDNDGFPSYAELLESNDETMWPGGDDLEEVWGNLQVLNLATVGALASELHTEQIPTLHSTLNDMSLEGGTLVFITIGGNDMENVDSVVGIGAETADVVGAELAVVAEHFQNPAHFPDGAWVFVGNTYDPSGEGDKAGDCYEGLTATFMDEELSGYNDRLLDWAQDANFALVDFYGHFRQHGYGDLDPEATAPLDPNPPHWFATCSQPNARGHHEIRSLFWDVVHTADSAGSE